MYVFLCFWFAFTVFCFLYTFFFFKQKTAYEMRISDWSSDVCSSDLILGRMGGAYLRHDGAEHILCFAPTRSGKGVGLVVPTLLTWPGSCIVHDIKGENRSEEHTSELQSLMRISYAVFCLKQNNIHMT